MFKSFLRFVGITVCCVAFSSSAFAACSSSQYTGYDGQCKTCPTVWNSNSAVSTNYDAGTVAPQTCGSGTYTCPYMSYRMKGVDGKYKCATCPKINNPSTFNLGSTRESPYKLVAPYNDWTTWDSYYRCYGTTKVVRQMADGNNAHYIIRFQPDSDCDSRYFCRSGEDCTDWSNYMADSTGCNYKIVVKIYQDAPAGYYVQNNNSISATSVICPVGTFKSGTGVVNVCNNCPIDMPSNDVGTWVNGTTSGTGTTSVDSCYVSGGNLTSGSDGTGTYQYGGNCYGTGYSNGFRGYVLELSFDSSEEQNAWAHTDGVCYNAVKYFFSNYMHYSEPALTSNTQGLIGYMQQQSIAITAHNVYVDGYSTEDFMRNLMSYIGTTQIYPSNEAPYCRDSIYIYTQQ